MLPVDDDANCFCSVWWTREEGAGIDWIGVGVIEGVDGVNGVDGVVGVVGVEGVERRKNLSLVSSPP